MKPVPLVAAVLIVAALGIRFRRLPIAVRALARALALALIAWGSGLITFPASRPSLAISEPRWVPTRTRWSARWPFWRRLRARPCRSREAAVVIGGVTAGQGHTNLAVLIGVVWACAFTGDLTSYALDGGWGGGTRSSTAASSSSRPPALGTWRNFQMPRVQDHHRRSLHRAGASARTVRGRLLADACQQLPPGKCVAAGIWSAAFSSLGYLFWQSFAQAAEIARQGTFAFAALVIAIVVVVVAYRTLRTRRTRLRSRDGCQAPWASGAAAGWICVPALTRFQLAPRLKEN